MERGIDKERPESVEIRFGLVFTIIEFGTEAITQQVIIDIGEGNSFSCASLYFEKATRLLGQVGTLDSDKFFQVMGQLSPEEVIKAAERGARFLEFPFTEETKRWYEEMAQKGSRILDLRKKPD